MRVLALDVDGVLTDGTLLYGPEGSVFQRFCVYDGYGIRWLSRAGVETVVVTAKTFPSLRHRAKALGLRSVVQGREDKADVLRLLASERGLDLSEFGFVGDDLADLGAMALAGWSAAPANARPEVRSAADYVCESRGGEGAVREAAEAILKAKGAWPPAEASP